jgi:hypothetical protein
MSKTVHRNAKRERQGFTVHRDVRRAPRRLTTREAIVRAELDTDRPAVRAALRS